VINDLAAYGGLFLIAFIAATLLPAQSEAALVALILAGDQPITALVAVASLGNIAGSAVNWVAGYWLAQYADRRWFPISPASLDKAARWYQRWGVWSLLLSWAPIIGDPLTVAAGVMREPFPLFLLLVAIAKIGRYILLAAATATFA